MNQKVKKAAIIIAIPVGYALLMRMVFGLDIVKDFIRVMSVTFLVATPFVIGFLTVAFSPRKDAIRISYAALAPWVPIGVFFVVTLLLAIEGAACWLMILPVFLAFATLGGLFARFILFRKDKPNKLQVSFVMLLPFALAPFEKLLPDLPARYEAYTFADIHAPADKIWANVVRVRTIPEQADHGTLTRFLGFPRPIRAELDYAGVGGSRQAIFSKGLVFKEVVLEYTDQKKMHFSITANPHDIPSTTMDKHVVIGGDYFNVLDGTYELERLSDSVYRLHLYSHFTLRTTFNFYASWWAGWIMKDIQNNILQVIRTRSEAKLLYPGMSLSTKKTLVLGASSNPERYSYLAVRRLRNAGHPVSAIGRKAATLGDVEISVDRGAIDDLDTVTLYLNPVNQKEYYDYILSLHPRRIIFNPGAENPELEALAFANGIEPVEACTLVLLSTGQY